MTSVPSAFARALGQLGDRRVLGVLAKSMGVTLAIVAALGFALWQGTERLIAHYASGYGAVGGLIGIVLAVIAGWLLFRIIALFVLQFFADELARAVAVNAIALPIALLLLVTGVGTAILFWAVNAWLLGRELQDMVWLRHRPDKDAAPPLGGLTRFALGGIVTGMLLVPFVNLLAPVLGAAAATHLVHGRRVRA
jgi:CysZ protein